MRRCIAIGGVPGTGKTTLMRKFLGDVYLISAQLRKLVQGHILNEVIVLGDYSDTSKTFAGTDTFSMAVQPEAETFFTENKLNVVYEGDRIFNGSMLKHIQKEDYELLVLIIEADEKLLKERYAARGSDQSEKFINGRRTKYQNIKDDATLPVYVARHENSRDTDAIVHAMKEFLEKGTIDSCLQKVEHDSLDDFFS
jgi:broad-specificity NMP kinase